MGARRLTTAASFTDSITGGNMSDHVYKHIELTGSSTQSSDHAIAVAIHKAAQSLRNMHWFRVTETRGVIDKDKITHWQVTLTVGFTLED